MLPIKIKLPEGFLNPEVRSGYNVSAKLKKVWAVDLDLFQELSRVCNKYDIKFQICYGTLIGAVRHKGFIPWDDDFDVWMTRDNLDKLMAVADEFKHPYFLQTPLNDRKFCCPLCRLRNSETTGAVAGFESAEYNNGIYIDIYAMDGVSLSRVKCALQYVLKRVVARMWSLRGQTKPRENTLKEKIEFYLIRPFSLVLSYEQWSRLYVVILSMYTKSSNKLSHMGTINWRGKRNWVCKSDLDNTIFVKYEHIQVPIPRNYDEILKRDYGNYMEFPPFEERGKWHEGAICFEPEIPYTEYFAAMTHVGI